MLACSLALLIRHCDAIAGCSIETHCCVAGRLLVERIATVWAMFAIHRALICWQGAGSVSSCSNEKQGEKEAAAVNARTRAQTRAQASKAVTQERQVALSCQSAMLLAPEKCFSFKMPRSLLFTFTVNLCHRSCSATKRERFAGCKAQPVANTCCSGLALFSLQMQRGLLQRKRAEGEQFPSGPMQRKRAKTGRTGEGGMSVQPAVSMSGGPDATRKDTPILWTTGGAAAVAGAGAVAGAVAGAAAVAAAPVTSTEPGALRGSAFDRVSQQIPSLQYIESVLLSAKQSPEERDAAAHCGTITVQMPRSVLDSGSFWLQAQCGKHISEPFAMPRYTVTMKKQSMSRFQDHWRRFMYPPDTLRRVQ